MPAKGTHKPRLCKKCGESRETEFYEFSRSECKRCACIRTGAYHKDDPEYNHRRHLHRSYKITPEKHAEILAEQNGVCALCGKLPTDDDLQKFLVVDHDHKTGKIRGLIHGRCNAVLGYAKEDEITLSAAIDYLRRHKS
jgi:Recombination endonuclease VII